MNKTEIINKNIQQIDKTIKTIETSSRYIKNALDALRKWFGVGIAMIGQLTGLSADKLVLFLDVMEQISKLNEEKRKIYENMKTLYHEKLEYISYLDNERDERYSSTINDLQYNEHDIFIQEKQLTEQLKQQLNALLINITPYVVPGFSEYMLVFNGINEVITQSENIVQLSQEYTVPGSWVGGSRFLRKI